MSPATTGFKRILVTGAGGQLGRAFRRAFLNRSPLFPVFVDSQVFYSDVEGENPCNLSDPAAILSLLERIKPDLILNPGAYTAVDRAECEESLALAVNAEAPAVMARWVRAHDAMMIHYSTDYVFDGSGVTPWQEDSPTGPLSIYGQTKLAGETAVLATGVQGAIFRSSWVYSDEGHNFIKTMLRLGAERDELRVVSDQTGVPTSAHFLARMTLHALNSANARDGKDDLNLMSQAAVYHLVPRGTLNWHQFAEEILGAARHAGKDIRATKVTAIASSEYPTPAKRPLNSRLDCSRFERTFGIKLDDWRVDFEKVMAAILSR